MQRSTLPALALALLLAVIASPAGAQQNGIGRPPEMSAKAPAGPPRGPAGRPTEGPGPRPAPAVLMGTLVDEASGRPLPTASIEVRSEQDSSLVAGALTDAEGRYRIEGLAPGRYFVRASTLGYAPSELPAVALTPGAVVRLDPVRLSVRALALQGIEVTAERAPVRMQADRTVFSARNLPSASGGNATDVLRNVPSVDVDADGQVSLRGSANVVLQINGRPAPFRGDALALYLKQLPAGAVDRVEVLPNPAAKYDPEGMSGIVNIVLRRNTDLGLSAAVTVAGSSRDRFNGSGSLGFQRGRLNLAGMYAVNSDQRRPTGFMERLSLAGVSAGETIVQDSRGLQESLGHSLTGNLDFKLRPATTLSFQASGNLNGNDGLSVNGFRLSGASDASGRTWASATGTERDLRSGDLMLGLRHVPAAGRSEIALEARLSGNDDVSEARYGDATLASLRELTRNETGNRDASLQLDVTRTLLGTKVEIGARAEERVIETDLSRSPLSDTMDGVGGAAAVNGNNAFDYDARIWAGYAQAGRAVGRVSLQGGLRVERADTRFDLRTTGEAYDNRYTSLYPSASALLDLGEGRSVRAGYSRRVQRPRTGQLNPFPLQEDSLSLLVGNPSLLPQYTNSFDLTLQTAGPLGTLQVAPFYRVTTDLIRHYKTMDPATGVSTTTFRNFDRSSQFGLDVTATGRLGSRLSGMLGANVAQVSTSAENLQAGLASNALSWSVRSNATLRLGPLTDVQGFVMYRAPMEIEQGRMRAFVVSNVSLRHRVLGGKGDVVLRVTDPLGRMNFGFTTADELHQQEFLRRMDARSVALSFSYAFGRPPSLRPRAAEAMEMDIR